MAAGGGAKRRFQYCTDASGAIVYFRAIQGHSGRNLIDPSLHDNVLIPNTFFEYIYHTRCAINLHSITNSGLIAGQEQCLKNADFVKTFAKRFGIGQWSFIGPGSEKKWYPSENSPQGEWDRIAEDMLLRFAESGHPIFRATTPLSRGKLKSKGKGKVSIHFSAEPDTIDTIYRIFSLSIQLSIYGAVAAICDEYEGQPDNTGEPVILEGQSIVLGKVKAEVPAQEEPEDSNILLRKYFQQVQRLSPEDRLSKFCKEAGFMSVVEVGQYFVTRNASEFLHTAACREYTLPRDDPASEPKRVDSRKHENWTYFGSHDELSALQIRSRSSNSIRERRQFSVLGQNFVWNHSLCEQLYQVQHSKSCKSTRRGSSTSKLRGDCSQIESKSETPTEGIFWHGDHSIE